MATQTNLPSYLCYSSDGSYSRDNSDSSDSSDRSDRSDQQSLFTKAIAHRKK